jgi:hypothetical protein
MQAATHAELATIRPVVAQLRAEELQAQKHPDALSQGLLVDDGGGVRRHKGSV